MSDKVYQCPLCKNDSCGWLTCKKNVPLLQNILYPAMTVAQAAQKIDIDYYYCDNCHFAFNPNFSFDKVDYSRFINREQKETDGHRKIMDGIAEVLVQDLGLKSSSRVLEIGCGTGYLLKKIRDVSKCKLIRGYDPGYNGVHDLENVVLPEFYKEYDEQKYDLVILRHVLDQIVYHNEVVDALDHYIRDGACIYIETLDLENLLRSKSTAKMSLEAYHYYSIRALDHLLCQHQAIIDRVYRHFHNHYIGVVIKSECKKTAFNRESQMTEVIKSYEKVVMWGSTMSAITFLTNQDLTAQFVAFVVDQDLKNHDMYVPVTAQKIISPRMAKKFNPDLIIVANKQALQSVRLQFGQDCDYLTLDGKLYLKSEE
jgi:SAM-dependent methyltransferase